MQFYKCIINEEVESAGKFQDRSLSSLSTAATAVALASCSPSLILSSSKYGSMEQVWDFEYSTQLEIIAYDSMHP